MSEGVLSDVSRLIWFSTIFWNLAHMVFPGVSEGLILVLINESFKVNMIGE